MEARLNFSPDIAQLYFTWNKKPRGAKKGTKETRNGEKTWKNQQNRRKKNFLGEAPSRLHVITHECAMWLRWSAQFQGKFQLVEPQGVTPISCSWDMEGRGEVGGRHTRYNSQLPYTSNDSVKTWYHCLNESNNLVLTCDLDVCNFPLTNEQIRDRLMLNPLKDGRWYYISNLIAVICFNCSAPIIQKR